MFIIKKNGTQYIELWNRFINNSKKRYSINKYYYSNKNEHLFQISKCKNTSNFEYNALFYLNMQILVIRAFFRKILCKIKEHKEGN